MSDLAVSGSVSGSIQIQTMDDLARVSKMLSSSGFFNDAKDVAQCGVKVLAGAEMGFGAFASMTGIHIVKGKPSVGANLMAAAVKKHPNYNYRVLEHTAEVCKIAFFERWDGAKFEQVGVSEFTAADAKRAGTQNMDRYPKNMLFARAMSNGIKWFCPDIFDAPVYTPEELGAATDEEGNYLDVQVVEPEIEPAPVQEMPTQGISMEQRKRMFAIAKECGVTDDQIKETIMDQFGITSTKELTQDNYRSLISWIESQQMAPVHEPIPDGDPEADEPLQF